VITIVLSRGNVYVLGEAYAFGVIWSCAFNAVSVLILRYKRPDAPRPWRVPFNPRLAGREMPLGLLGIAVVLFACAVVNLFTKQVATMAGVTFTGACFGLFVVSERIATKRRAAGAPLLDQFQLDAGKTIDADALGTRAGNVLVPVRDYNTLSQLDWVLGQPESDERDVVVLTVRVLGSGQHGMPGIGEDQIFSEYEQQLFTRVVAIAERLGRRVTLLVAPGTSIFDALVQAAVQLRSGLIVVGESEIMTPERQALLTGEAWDRTPGDIDRSTRFVVVCKDGGVRRFSLGAHAPDLSSADLDRIHRLWVEAVDIVGPDLHHRDVVTAALATLERDLHGERRAAAVDVLRAQKAS
jgi:hypothetical protein